MTTKIHESVCIDIEGTHGKYSVKIPKFLDEKELRKEFEVCCAEYSGLDITTEKAANSYGVAYEQIKDFANGKNVNISQVVLNQIYWTVKSKIDVPWWNVPEKTLLKWAMEDLKNQKG